MAANACEDRISEFRGVNSRKLLLSLTITIVFMFVELVGGILVNSIALINDAGHMFTHSFSITIALVGARIAQKPACHHKTFGSYRAEILAAFINGLFLVVVVVFLMYEAIERIFNPVEIDTVYMLIIAIVGLIVNLISISILHESQKNDLNVRGVFTHIIADTGSSVGIVIVAFVIMYTDLTILDPLVSLGIAVVILVWAAGILRESGRILLEIAPRGMDINQITTDLKDTFPEIAEIQHMHLWTITSNMNVVSFHLLLKPETAESTNLNDLYGRINDYLANKYKIIETTIQMATDDEVFGCRLP